MDCDFPSLIPADVRIAAGAKQMTANIGINGIGGNAAEIRFADADLCPDIDCGMMPPSVVLTIPATLLRPDDCFRAGRRFQRTDQESIARPQIG